MTIALPLYTSRDGEHVRAAPIAGVDDFAERVWLALPNGARVAIPLSRIEIIERYPLLSGDYVAFEPTGGPGTVWPSGAFKMEFTPVTDGAPGADGSSHESREEEGAHAPQHETRP